jgi:aryl-alcohol dehydrogenase-like predicted oxidoreductase
MLPPLPGLRSGAKGAVMRTMTSKEPRADAAGTVAIGDLRVNRLGFGAMRLCGRDIWGPPDDRAAAHRVLGRAVELGVNFIDTADSYGPHVDEILIAEALQPYPRGLVIATKGGLVRPNRHAWDSDARPEHLRQAVDGSLRRLKLERIDLYQLHAPDPRVPFAESVGALAEAQRAGKLRHLGLSNVSVRQLETARKIATIVSVQNEYSFDDRSSDDVLAACAKLGIAFIPWYPLGAGRCLRSAKLKRVAAQRGVSVAQVALAWLLARSPVVLPIPGTASLAHLEENVRAASLVLTEPDRAALG